MGTHREQLIEISATAGPSRDRAEAVIDRLRDGGWIRADGPAGDDYAHGLFLTDFAESAHAGDGLLARFADMREDTVVTVLTTGVDSRTWDPGQGSGMPDCPECETELGDAEDDWTTVKAWLDSGVEPQLSCRECGFTALVGDWDLRQSVAFGELGVVLDLHERGHDGGADQGEVTGALLDALRAGGGRWVWVHKHR